MRDDDELRLANGVEKGLIHFSEDDKTIEYLPLGFRRSYGDRNPEEKVRALYFLDLVSRYHYPASRIEFETEMPSRVPRYFADIVVYEDDAKKKPYIVIECKKDGISDAEFEQATKQAIGNARVLKAPYAVCIAGNTQRVMETDRWNNKTPEEATIASLPISYGLIQEWRYKKGDEQWDLKTVERGELIRALEKSHDTLWGGGKRNPTVAFDELCKIIFVKIRDEKKARKNAEPYDFQIKTHEKAESVHERIENIYQEAKQRDPEVFTEDIKVTAQEMYAVVQHLQGLSLSGTDLDTKGVAFERFMEDFFKGKSGQFFTPRNIVKAAVRMMSVSNEDKLLDPACGSGGFLLYALDAIRDQANDIFGKAPAGQDAIDHHRYWHDFAEKKLFGIEINDSLARVAKMNMIIHDDGHTNVIRSDGLGSIDVMHEKNQGFGLGEFDFILTNPPFGSSVKRSEHQYIENYRLGHNGKNIRENQKTEILFIERCIDFLKPGSGRMAIVLPDGILTNTSLQYVRDFILEKCELLAIVGLPAFAFSHYGAGVKSSLVFLRKRASNETASKYRIFMARAEHIGYDSTGKHDNQNDLDTIAEAYLNFASGEDTNKTDVDWFTVNSDQLEERLDPYRYLPEHNIDFGRHKTLAFEEVFSLVTDGDHGNPKYTDIEGEGVPYLRVTDVKNGVIDWSNVRNVSTPYANKLSASCYTQKGDFLLSIVGTLGEVVYVDFDKKVAVSRGFAILRMNNSSEVLPEYLGEMLASRITKVQLEKYKVGSVQQGVYLSSLKKFQLPTPEIAIQRQIIDKTSELRKKAEDLTREALELRKKAEDVIEGVVLG